MPDLVFEVVGRSKTERVKKGGREVVFKVSLESLDGKCKLSLTDKDSKIIQQYPLESKVPVKVGVSNQRTLTEAQVEKEVRKAAEASQEEAAEKK
jgi:hypothetical protein